MAVLLKQHFCTDMNESTISVQASEHTKQALSFYKKLGFIEYNTPDSAFSMLPRDLQHKFTKNSLLWIPDDGGLMC